MVASVSGVDLEGLGLNVPSVQKKDELGQEDFLNLMITQLKNQDPFKPMESGEFLGQLAQFGTVQGLAGLQTSFDSLAGSLVSSQALQAASLVGREALVAGSKVSLEAGAGASGAIELPSASSQVRIQVRDSTGQLVREIQLGNQSAGLVPFSWDGRVDGGDVAPTGRYSFTADFLNGEKTEAANTLLSVSIDSVRFGADGFSVQARGIGEVPFTAVREIRNPITNDATADEAAAVTN
jgi:flagellar basal-body rod modification protein FlgD